MCCFAVCWEAGPCSTVRWVACRVCVRSDARSGARSDPPRKCLLAPYVVYETHKLCELGLARRVHPLVDTCCMP